LVPAGGYSDIQHALFRRQAEKGKSMLCKSFSPAGQFINETNTELSKES
jgi:hypothetical protein